MTVNELINALRGLPGDWPVYVRGYESGVNDVTDVEVGHFRRDVNQETYFGQHERALVGRAPLNGVELTGFNEHPAGTR